MITRHVFQTDLTLKKGDITEESTDAIVNAANEHLMHGGGVAYAIAKKAGSILEEESRGIGYVPTGSAAITSGGNLPAKYVIHAVGPVWRGGKSNEPQLLRSAIRSSLELAKKHELKSISFPAISTGIFGYPLKNAAREMLSETLQFLRENPGELKLVQFVLFTDLDFETFKQELVQLIPE